MAENKQNQQNAAREADVHTGGPDINSAPGATNQGNNPSNAEAAAAPAGDLADDREAVARSVDADAEKETGKPTGAIYGSGGDIISAQGFDESAGDDTQSEQNQ